MLPVILTERVWLKPLRALLQKGYDYALSQYEESLAD